MNFEVLFCGIPDQEDFSFSGEIGFKGTRSFNVGFQFIPHKAHVALNRFGEYRVKWQFKVVPVINTIRLGIQTYILQRRIPDILGLV